MNIRKVWRSQWLALCEAILQPAFQPVAATAR